MHYTNNLRGGTVMLVAVGSFSLMDAGMKALSASYPPLQVAALRALSSLPLIIIWIALTGGFRQLAHVRFGLHLLRGALGIVMLASFIYAVSHLPLSESYSIFFVAPLLITAFAALILKERVDWQRWAAIFAGLCGVLIVLKPAGDRVITLAGLAVLICAVSYALSAITVRILGRTDSTQSMVFWVMAMVAAGAGLLALPGWRGIQPEDWLVIFGVGLAGGVGQWAITEAFRIGESSFIAPFEYTALAWGVGLDWLVWRTLPGSRAILGAAVIIASGIYLFRRERKGRREEPPAHSSPAALPGDAG